MTVYVLSECCDKYPIGVFDSPQSAVEGIANYYGEYEEITHNQIDDSGLEWEKEIKTSEGVIYDIVLRYYEMNDV